MHSEQIWPQCLHGIRLLAFKYGGGMHSKQIWPQHACTACVNLHSNMGAKCTASRYGHNMPARHVLTCIQIWGRNAERADMATTCLHGMRLLAFKYGGEMHSEQIWPQHACTACVNLHSNMGAKCTASRYGHNMPARHALTCIQIWGQMCKQLQAHLPRKLLGLFICLKLNVEHAREVLAQAVAGGSLNALACLWDKRLHAATGWHGHVQTMQRTVFPLKQASRMTQGNF